MSEYSIKIAEICKIYQLYDKPTDRIKETFLPGKYSREFKALDGISFDVKKGETVGIIGTNGAGKSTLLKIITGVLTQTSGTISVCGKISALLELGAGFNQEYTGIQNIYLNGRMMGYSQKEMEKKIEGIKEFADIGDFIYQPVKLYSSGMFARLAFAVAINVEPDILIVDEALSVGDLFFQNKCFRKFEELKKKGVTILFVSHDISSVRQMCSRVLWIENGKQKMFDSADKVCDLYMDEKRMRMNSQLEKTTKCLESIPVERGNGILRIPKIGVKECTLKSDEFEIISCYFNDKYGKETTHLSVDQEYETHILVQLKTDLNNLIVGFVLENNKGLPLYDVNNFINQEQVISGKQGEVLDITYSYKMPRLMRGMYVVSTAIAQGTQKSHKMLTWIHGVREVEIINDGYNSSFIEIPSIIKVRSLEIEQIEFEVE